MSSPTKDKEPSTAHAFVRAAANGDLTTVQSLLASGADVNRPNEEGQTALILAAVMGHADVVAHLISAGADPHMRDRLNLTALEWSTRRGFLEVTQLLTKISPPLQPLRIERQEAQTESERQASELPTTEPAAANREPPASSETAAVTVEQESSEEPETLAPPAEVVETSTSENVSEEAAVVTESAPSTAAVPHPPELVANEAESETTATELEVSPSATSEAQEVEAADISAAEIELEVPPSPITEAPPEVSASAVKAAQTESEVPPSPTTEALQEVSASAVKAAQTESEVPPSPTTEALPEVSAAVMTAAPPELEAPASPIPKASFEASAIAVDAPPSELEVPPSPTTAAFPEESAVAVNAAPPELEAPPSLTADTSPEVSAPALSATPTPDLQSWDPEYEAERVLSTDSVLMAEEDETLPQPQVPASKVDIGFSEAVSATASAETRQAPPPAGQTAAPVNRPGLFSGAKLGLSTAATADAATHVSSLKRCPRCGAIYKNSPLSFCTRDNATLVWTDEFHQFAAPTQTSSSPPIAVWLLIAFVLGASGFVAYRLTERFYRQPEPTPAAEKPIEAPTEVKKPTFTVGGNLAGRELTIPEPDYPGDLIATGITGSITVRVRVNKSGRVISASSSGGDSRLRSAAVKAARQATFAPAKLAEISPRGRAVTGSITYQFAPPQTSAAPSTATTSPTAASGPSPVPSPSSATSDPNAPGVSSELVSAVSNVPAADYPARAKQAGIGGAITVTVRVNRNGKVVSWRSSAGDSRLRAAAIKAARKATFAREKLPSGGDVVGTITYNFVP